MEEVMGEDLSAADFLWDLTRFRRNLVGNSTGHFPELSLEKLEFVCHKYYSIFLLQQEASAP
jgi:hypothetical protein